MGKLDMTMAGLGTGASSIGALLSAYSLGNDLGNAKNWWDHDTNLNVMSGAGALAAGAGTIAGGLGVVKNIRDMKDDTNNSAGKKRNGIWGALNSGLGALSGGIGATVSGISFLSGMGAINNFSDENIQDMTTKSNRWGGLASGILNLSEIGRSLWNYRKNKNNENLTGADREKLKAETKATVLNSLAGLVSNAGRFGGSFFAPDSAAGRIFTGISGIGGAIGSYLGGSGIKKMAGQGGGQPAGEQNPGGGQNLLQNHNQDNVNRGDISELNLNRLAEEEA